MNKVIILLSLSLLISCKSKKVSTVVPAESTVIKLATAEVNTDVKDKAYELGRRVLMTCNVSKFKPFNSAEATPTVIQNMTQERLTKTCLKFRLKYGDFKDLQLVEIFKLRSTNTTVFRFKALYEKKIANKELRLTMNEKNQVSAVKSLDWIDAYEKKTVQSNK